MSLLKAALYRILKLTLGWALVLLGIVGLFLPILQGVLFLALGFALLSAESQWVRQKSELFMSRYPGVAAKLRNMKRSVAKKWH